MTPFDRAKDPAAPGTNIGHVHLRVGDLARAIAFYRDVIGLNVTQRYGESAAFLSADGYHHHIGLNTWDSLGSGPPPNGHTGLYHTAFLFPSRPALAQAIKRALDAGVRLTGMADHGVSEAVYMDDPDGNGVELYRDKPRAVWPADEAGYLAMINAPLDLEDLLTDAL